MAGPRNKQRCDGACPVNCFLCKQVLLQGALAAAVFGRDEDDSDMELRQEDVDQNILCIKDLLEEWPLTEPFSKIFLNIRYGCRQAYRWHVRGALAYLARSCLQ